MFFHFSMQLQKKCRLYRAEKKYDIKAQRGIMQAIVSYGIAINYQNDTEIFYRKPVYGKFLEQSKSYKRHNIESNMILCLVFEGSYVSA